MLKLPVVTGRLAPCRFKLNPKAGGIGRRPVGGETVMPQQRFSQQHYSRPDKLRQRCEDENVVKSHDGCMARSLVSSAPLPEAAGFFTSQCMAPYAAFASPPVGLPDWSAMFSGYPAAMRTPGSQTGLPRLKQRFTGYTAATRNPRLPDGLAPSEAKVRGLASEPTSPVGGEPVGGCGGVGGVG